VNRVGSLPPGADTIDVIQQLVPGVKSVGTLYNSSEANSRKVVSVARDLFTKRGIKLEEVSVTGSSEVAQAAQVLASRNIQAIWITGDNTALQAFDAIVKVSLDRRLPLINNDPEFVDRGALACVGLGWYPVIWRSPSDKQVSLRKSWSRAVWMVTGPTT
jgi:putative ABC transport system substrate-binding protein